MGIKITGPGCSAYGRGYDPKGAACYYCAASTECEEMTEAEEHKRERDRR